MASALPSPFITASHALLDLDAITITNISTSNPACLSAASASPPRPSDPASWQLSVGASGRLLRHGMWLRLGSAVMRFMLRDYEEGMQRAKRESEKEREAEEAERVSISDQTTQIYNPDAYAAAEEGHERTTPQQFTSHLRSSHNAELAAGADAAYNASGFSPVFADADEESMNFMGTLPSNDTGEEGEAGAEDAAAQPGVEEQRPTEERQPTQEAAAIAAHRPAETEPSKAEGEAEEAPGSVIVLSGEGGDNASSPIVLSMPPSQRANEAPSTVPAQPAAAERYAGVEDEDERSPGAPSPAPLAPAALSREGEGDSLAASASASGKKATARSRRVPAGDLQQREGETVEQRIIREREEQEEKLREAAEEKRRREEEAFRQQEAERVREREERKRRAEEERKKEAEELQLRRERERVERQQALDREKAERVKQEEKERDQAERRRLEREEAERREEAEEEERQREVQRRIEEETKAARARARAKKEEEDKRRREEREQEEERERQRLAAAEAEQAAAAELERKRKAEATSQLEWRPKPRKGRAAAAAAEVEKLSATSSDASRKEEAEASSKAKSARTASTAGSSSGKASKAGRRTRQQREEQAVEEEEEEAPEQEQRAEVMQLDDPQQIAIEVVVEDAKELPAKSALHAVDRVKSRPGRQQARRGHLQLSEEDGNEETVDASKPSPATESAEVDEKPKQQAESAEAPPTAADLEEEKGGRSESTLLGVDALLDMTSASETSARSATHSQQQRKSSSSTASASDLPSELAATPQPRSSRKRRTADTVLLESEQAGEQQQTSTPSRVIKRTRTRSAEAGQDNTRATDGQQLLSPATTRGARRGHSVPDGVGESPTRTAASSEPDVPNIHGRRTVTSATFSLSSSAPILLLTGIAEPLQYAEAVSALGGSIASDYSPAVTHLISDRVRRTDKFLAAYSTAQHVVSISWLTASIASGAFLSPSSSPSFPLQDAEAEERYGFSLSAHRRSCDWLRGKHVWCSDHVQPGREAMRRIVAAGGGSVQDELDADSRQEAVIVIGCEEDRAQCEQLAGRGWTVHDRELLLTGVLRQMLEPELEQFILLQPTHSATAKGGKRAGAGRGRGRGRG